MSDVAVRAENLSKLYRIGERDRYFTLRDTIMKFVRRPLARFSDNGNGVSSSGLAESTIWALKDVSFEVKRGEVVGIIGRNGAGKSTLLKILSRITQPTEGEARIYGRVGSLLEVGSGFHPELTGRENIYLNGAILGMKKAEIDRKFDEIVAFAEVEKFIDTPIKHFSSGMYMRLAFAVAAHLEPEILFVDEVLAVGDVAFQRRCLGRMGDLAHEGRTVLFVSHNMTPIVQLCTHVIWLNTGKVVEKGDPRKVSSDYLRDSRVPLGEAVFDPSVGSRGATLLRGYVADEDLSVRPDIPYSKPFCIVFEYGVEGSINGLRVGVRLYNERNQAVLHTATSDGSSTNGTVGQAGKHRARVKIPGAWLAPGRYHAEVGLWSPLVGHHVHVMNALSFDIIAGTVESVGEEVLRPLLPWIVE